MPQDKPMPSEVDSLLAGVRRGIRLYVWIEGLAMLAVLAGGVFWIGLFVDWFFEPPREVRLLLIVAAAVAVVWVAYRFILSRAFVQLADRNLAVLIERRFRQFSDSLVTSVELQDRPAARSGYSETMLAETRERAAMQAAQAPPSDIFKQAPLVRLVLAAVLLAGSVAVFGMLSRDAFGFYLERIQLSEELWPRKTRLEVVGFAKDASGVRVVKVAEGRSLEVVVQADNTLVDPPPDRVELRYEQDNGSRGRADMKRIGEAVPGRDAHQEFSYVFKDVYQTFEFDVVGGDARIRSLRVEVVKNPEVLSMTLRCEYPAYMARADRELPVSGTMQIPLGAVLHLSATSNKPLREVKILDPDQAEPTLIPVGNRALEKSRLEPSQFDFDLGRIDRDRVLLFVLKDGDGIETLEPYRLAITALPDVPPEVDLSLLGIGTAVTAQARIPMQGDVRDDYGIDRIWFAHRSNEEDDPHEKDFQPAPDGAAKLEVLQALDIEPLELKPGEKLVLYVAASDRCDLGQGPNIGTGRRFLLDVVTPAELRASLERRELLLRRRFETIYNEMLDTRQQLAQVRIAGETNDTNDAEASDTGGDGDSGEGESGADKSNDDEPEQVETSEQQRERLLLQIGRVQQNVQRSGHETLAVADAFDEIRAEMVNNRIDTPELNNRLQGGIADPLREIGGRMISELEADLAALASTASATSSPDAAALQQATVRCDTTIVAMKEVLDRMLELESFNEVLELLRGIIDDQQQLIDRTEEERKRSLRNLLED